MPLWFWGLVRFEWIVRKALLLIVAACLTVVSATLPASATPVRAEAGLRAYFVITEPNQTGKVIGAVTQNGGTVYATYDAIGVIVAHSTAPDFVTNMRDREFVQESLALGEVGFVSKDRLVADLLPAIRRVLAGQTFVSPTVQR